MNEINNNNNNNEIDNNNEINNKNNNYNNNEIDNKNSNNEADSNNVEKVKNYYKENKKWFSIAGIIITIILILAMGMGLGSLITYFSMPSNNSSIEEPIEKPISPYEPVNDNKEIYSTQLEFHFGSTLVSRVNFEYYTYTECVWVDTYGKPAVTGYAAPETVFYNDYHQRIFVLNEDTPFTGSYYAPQDVLEAINNISYITYEVAAAVDGTFAEDVEFNFEFGVEPYWSFTDGTMTHAPEQTNSYISLN